MNTKNPSEDLLGGIALPDGIPSASEIARMANQFFAESGGPQNAFANAPAGFPSPPSSPPPLVIWGPPDVFGSAMVPTEVSIPVQSAAPMPAAPAMSPEPDGFAFLQETRQLFAPPIPGTGGPNPFADSLANILLPESPAYGLPMETGFIENDMVERPGPLVFDDPAHFSFVEEPRPFSPPSPTVLGALQGFDSSPMPAFSFLEEARPLFSSPPTAPGPVPAHATDSPNLSSGSFDAETIRRDFPILRETVNGRPLVWLDNAATTQKPQSVIDRLAYFYAHENSNVHRAAHELAARSTDAYESAREKVRRFLNASTTKEIVWARGATEGINLIAKSWGRRNIRKDDEIVITWLEHHANIVPWQMLCSETGARLRVAPVDDTGQVILEEYEKLLNPSTKLVSFAHVSNALGTVTPVNEMIQAAHRYGAKVLVDGAQAVSHMQVDVQALDCDFYVLSGHKMFAPTGIGVVYGKSEVLEHTPPWQGGGNMIQDVTFEKTIYHAPPARFEAGTGNIADAVGLGAAVDYLQKVGMPNVTRHEAELLAYGTDALKRVPGLKIIGTAHEKAGVLSFVLDSVRTEEMGDLLNREGIAVRAGHHCAQPIHRRFGLESTARASLALYNTCADLDALRDALLRITAARRGRN
jgi:cysteine desulfurase/selenocysteine lyase